MAVRGRNVGTLNELGDEISRFSRLIGGVGGRVELNGGRTEETTGEFTRKARDGSCEAYVLGTCN